MKDRNQHARVLVTCIVDGRPVVPGDEVLVDENTLANLVAKGRLEAVTPSVAHVPPVPPILPVKRPKK